ncbi:MAG TPA: hypothetical protein VK913_10860 [Erythrobacter sp.]|nr:hypothetical protein [Erythrobacter sp.]
MSEERLSPEDAPSNLYDDAGNPRFFADPGMDRFVAVVMNLAQEVWVQQERLLSLDEAKSGQPVDRDAIAREFIDRVFAPIRKA